MPNIVRPYDGSGDPDDHLNTFVGAAETELWSMPIWCRMFTQTLVGPTRVGFQALEPGGIGSFKELETKFKAFFTQQKRYIKGPIDVHKTKQRDGEGFKDFIERWKKDMLQVKGSSEEMKVSRFMQAIRPPTLIESLNTRGLDTVDEMMIRVKEFIKGKEDLEEWKSWEDKELEEDKILYGIPVLLLYTDPHKGKSISGHPVEKEDTTPIDQEMILATNSRIINL